MAHRDAQDIFCRVALARRGMHLRIGTARLLSASFRLWTMARIVSDGSPIASFRWFRRAGGRGRP
jgi:hypothetical protein